MMNEVLLELPLQGYKVDKGHTHACAMTKIQDIFFGALVRSVGLPKIPALSGQILRMGYRFRAKVNDYSPGIICRYVEQEC